MTRPSRGLKGEGRLSPAGARNGAPTRSRLSRRGFTLVELSIVAGLGVLLLLFVHQFFSSGVKNTLKGQDTLESIRAASLLFAHIRKDLLACQSVHTGAASVTMGVAALDLPTSVPPSDTLTFCARNATTTYSLVSTPQGKYVLRTFTPTVGSTETKTFGVPRMERFEVLQVWKNHRILSTRIKPGQVLVHVVIDSNDPRIPTKEIRLSSVFISQQLTTSDWNYFFP